MTSTAVICDRCGAECVPSKVTTGFGETEDGKCYCFKCCGELDKADMIETGKATLYLVKRDGAPVRERGHYVGPDYEVTNWPGTLRLPVHGIRTGRHNRAGRTYMVAFRGPDGYLWRGTQYGDNTQICRCKRTKVVLPVRQDTQPTSDQ